MIIVDSSALIAILDNEDDAPRYAEALYNADRLLISAVNVHETGIVLRIRRGEAAPTRLWRFLLEENDFEIVPFDEVHAHEALAAFGRYGKGIDARARLNLADCRVRARKDRKGSFAIQRRRFCRNGHRSLPLELSKGHGCISQEVSVGVSNFSRVSKGRRVSWRNDLCLVRARRRVIVATVAGDLHGRVRQPSDRPTSDQIRCDRIAGPVCPGRVRFRHPWGSLDK